MSGFSSKLQTCLKEGSLSRLSLITYCKSVWKRWRLKQACLKASLQADEVAVSESTHAMLDRRKRIIKPISLVHNISGSLIGKKTEKEKARLHGQGRGRLRLHFIFPFCEPCMSETKHLLISNVHFNFQVLPWLRDRNRSTVPTLQNRVT